MDDESFFDLGLDEELPTKRQFEVLINIIRYMRTNQDNLPDNIWLANRLTVGTSAICNHKKALKSKGFLNARSYPTKKAFELVENRPIVVTAQVPMLGQVTGGPSEHEDVLVEIDGKDLEKIDLMDDDALKTITIPNTLGATRTFALHVVGESMVHEHIFDGDYVIVEIFDKNVGPKQGELIVTEYLIPNKPIDPELFNDWFSIPDGYRGGPTVKYLYEESERGFYRLGLRKKYDQSEEKDTIITKHIQPIGRVIGVYRALPT